MSQRRLPAEIYWRRRLLLLAVLILIAWLGLHFWPGADSDERPGLRAGQDGNSIAHPEAGADGWHHRPSRCRPTPRHATPSRFASTRPFLTDQHTRGPVDVDLTISSTSKTPCTFSAVSADLLVVISAGKTAIWDSTVCKTSLVSDPVNLSPGWSTVVPTEWSGRGSGRACSKKEGWATPGSYTIQIGTLGGEPGKAKFILTPPPKEDTKSDEKKDDKSADDKKADEKKDDKS